MTKPTKEQLLAECRSLRGAGLKTIWSNVENARREISWLKGVLESRLNNFGKWYYEAEDFGLESFEVPFVANYFSRNPENKLWQVMVIENGSISIRRLGKVDWLELGE